MSAVLGVLAIAFLVFIVAGAVTGRVKARSCCSVGSPDQDLRMRAALDAVDPAPSS
jgi:hypothetical protein